jgi:peptide/nickel transport system permease protein
VRTARAKGVREWMVVNRHALANALIPVITVTGITFALLLAGAVISENVFAIKGVGRLVIEAILNRDFPVVQGAILVIAGLFVLTNLVVDVLYAVVNPKIRYGN